MALGTTYEELWHLQSLLGKSEQFQEIRALLKLYVTSWMTISDVVAVLINEIYDLGYAEQDIELSIILRNSHIKKTEIAKVISKHRKTVQHEHYANAPHDVVHRGKLDDPGWRNERRVVGQGPRFNHQIDVENKAKQEIKH